ncbi:MAG: NAD-dependent epimerase/dehydratase family protein [Myxococcales bacterium]|nr:NAD-dependent epimerase/dehydratase family protein [Myxococcales bacterium]
MKIAITGGTGFVGRHLAGALVGRGHEVVLVARGRDRRDPEVTRRPGVSLVRASIDDTPALARAFDGRSAVAHCAGINREIGEQTHEKVHLQLSSKPHRGPQSARGAIAQVHILAEGAAEPTQGAVARPDALTPRRSFVAAPLRSVEDFQRRAVST